MALPIPVKRSDDCRVYYYVFNCVKGYIGLLTATLFIHTAENLNGAFVFVIILIMLQENDCIDD